MVSRRRQTPHHLGFGLVKVIVTGGNSGIGKAIATCLAGSGHHVVLACRSLMNAQAAASEMVGRIEVRHLESVDLTSVKAFADDIDHADVLINNAGVMGLPLRHTDHGFETHMATNHLGPFALTCALGNKVSDRVIFVGSASHRLSRLRVDDLDWRSRPYSMMAAYADSKRASMLFATSLAARGVRAYIAEPGAAGTQIGRESTGLLGWIRTHEPRLLSMALQSETSAARSVLDAIITDLSTGSLLAPRYVLWGRSVPKKLPSSVLDQQLAQQLWERSAALTGFDWHSSAAPSSKGHPDNG